MRILLIYPTMTVHGDDISSASAIPPVGLAYIAAYMERLGHEVQIIDCIGEGIDNVKEFDGNIRTGLSDKVIQQRIEDFAPQIVGISSMFSAYADDAYRLASLVKRINPCTPVVMSGAHVCAMTQRVLKQECVDVCVIGEGELTFAELVERLSTGIDYYDIDGIAYRKGDKCIYNKERALIENLDTLPFPARHLLPMESYFTRHKNPYVYYDRHTFMITSRGCPMHCVYCSIHSVWKYKWRARSAENVVAEIGHLVKDYRIKEIQFVDDNLTVDKKRIYEICRLLIEKKIEIKWTCPNGIAIWHLDENLLRLMKKSGCYRLTFGIESGSEVTQKFIGKNLDLEKVKRNIAYANKIGLWTISTYIFGFPYQDKEQIVESINFAISSNTDFAIFYPLMPFPATKLWDIVKDENLIDEKDFFRNIGYYLSRRGLDSKHFTHEEIQQLATNAARIMFRKQIKSFIFNPIHYCRKVRSVKDLIYFMKLMRNFVMIVKNIYMTQNKVGGSICWNKNAMTRG